MCFEAWEWQCRVLKKRVAVHERDEPVAARERLGDGRELAVARMALVRPVVADGFAHSQVEEVVAVAAVW